MPRSSGLATEHRELLSDFLLVKLPGRRLSIPFRDVLEVDGREVGDREARLTRLFLQPAPDALTRAREIAAESARYNIGRVVRTVNLPTPRWPWTYCARQPSRGSAFRISRVTPRWAPMCTP